MSEKSSSLSGKGANQSDADEIYPVVAAPITEPNLKLNPRGSYQPPGYKPASKDTLVSFGQPSSSSSNLGLEEQSAADQRATKRRSYVPAGFVLHRPEYPDPIVSAQLPKTSADEKAEKEKKRRSYMPPVRSNSTSHHGPLVKVDLKRPVTFTSGFSSIELAKRKTLSPTHPAAAIPRTRTLFDKTRVAKSKRHSVNQSNNNRRSMVSPAHKNNRNSTLINLEAGVSIISKAKAVNHTIVAKYKPDDPSFFLDPESMATIRAVFLLICCGYMGWCLYYQKWSFFISLTGWCWVGYLLYFAISLAETLWFLDEQQQVMFPYQPEITEALFASTSALTFTVPAIYWAFTFWPYIRNLIYKTPFSLNMIEVQDLVGAHLPFFLIIPEIFISRRQVEKMFAVVPSIAILCYMGLVWMLHYQFGWDWPVGLSTFFVNYLQWDMSPISLFIAVMVAVLMTATSTIFVYWCCSLRGQLQKKKLELEEEKQQKKRQEAEL